MTHRLAVAMAVQFAVALALTGLVAGRVCAQRTTVPEEQLVSLDIDNAELADVIDTIARMTNRNIIYDNRVRGRVTIVTPTPIPVDQAYAVFHSALEVKGFTTVITPGGAVKVIPLRDATVSSCPPPNCDDDCDPTRNPSNFFSQARLVPKYADGEIVGLQVNAIKAGSLFEEVGIQCGDVITHFNGISFSNPEKSAKVVAESYDAENFTVDVTRQDGSTTTLEFIVEE